MDRQRVNAVCLPVAQSSPNPTPPPLVSCDCCQQTGSSCASAHHQLHMGQGYACDGEGQLYGCIYGAFFWWLQVVATATTVTKSIYTILHPLPTTQTTDPKAAAMHTYSCMHTHKHPVKTSKPISPNNIEYGRVEKIPVAKYCPFYRL